MAGITSPQNDVRDEVVTPLVDSLDLTNAAFAGGLSNAVNAFFKAGGGGKAISQYNVPGGGPTLPYQNSYLVMGLGFLGQNFYTTNPGQLLAIINEKSSLSLVVGTKPYLQVPVREVTGGVWQSSSSATTVAATTIHDLQQSFGPPKAMAMMFDRAHAIPIAPQQNFEVDWSMEGLSATEIADTTPAANAPVRLQAVLYGILRRPVQ